MPHAIDALAHVLFTLCQLRRRQDAARLDALGPRAPRQAQCCRTDLRDVPIVVVTVDPWRDTPDRLAMLASMWSLTAGDRVLSGAPAEVGRVLDTLGVFRQRDERTGEVAHGAVVFVVDTRGRLAWRVDGGTAEVEGLLRRL